MGFSAPKRRSPCETHRPIVIDVQGITLDGTDLQRRDKKDQPCPGDSGGYLKYLDMGYPLVNIQKTMENHRFHGKFHYFYGDFP